MKWQDAGKKKYEKTTITWIGLLPIIKIEEITPKEKTTITWIGPFPIISTAKYKESG